LVELLHALRDFDLARGGGGLVVDLAASGAAPGAMRVVLRPLDVRWSLDRFTEMAALLGGAASPEADAVPGQLDPHGIADVVALYDQRGQPENGAARDRIQRWRAGREWVAGFSAAIVGGKAG
jgi:hypothetical protein